MGIYDRDYYQEDQLRPIRPWDSQSMVIMLIMANIAFFVANFLIDARGNYLTNLMTLHASDLLHPLAWPRFLTHGFAHDPRGIMHILFNMIGLYFLGQSVEAKYGKWEFMRFYLLCIITCGLVWASIRVATGNDGAVIGASGAVTGVAMLFVFSFPNATLQLYGIIPVKAWLVGIMIVVANLFGNPSSGVAYDIHLMGVAFAAVYFYGGLNFGFLSGWLSTGKTKIKQKQRGFKVRRDDSPSGPSAADEKESDRILEKILKDGKDSLTRKERNFMQRYSSEMRKRKQNG